MIFHWLKNEEYNSISIYLSSDDERFALHFEDRLEESSWTYTNKAKEVSSSIISKELMNALREHLEARK